ncbi:MAG: hypothetical protein KDC38_14305, partial [Planctomycetes bacterium]|nr:hypothetical protein [Planctomycetota bacterium]
PQFSGFDSGAELAEWMWYRKPATAVVKQKAVVEPPAHEGPKLTRIAVRRDKSLLRPIHVLEGIRSKVKNARITELVVERRKTGDSGWEKVADVPNGESFSIDITDGEAGESYDYRIRSTAETTSAKAFGEGEAEKLSGEVTCRLPNDVIWSFSSPREPDYATQRPASCWLKRERWNYEKEEREVERAQFDAPLTMKEFDKLPTIFDTGWRLRSVKKGKEGKWEVELRNPERETLEIHEDQWESQDLDARECMGDPTESGEEETSSAEPKEGETAGTTPEPSQPAPSKGDDDDDL